jgi:hypothetical protein
MSYMSPLHRQLRDDIRPPMFAAELLLSDAPLPHPWFGKSSSHSPDFAMKSTAHQWLDAHELIMRAADGSITWARKGELYRARIRNVGITHIVDLWQWSREGNGPSVWHLPPNGKPWP